MQQIAPGKYKMAHYAFATGLMNLGIMVPSMLSGLISDWLGYKTFFIWVLIATIPSFIVTWLVPYKNNIGNETEDQLTFFQIPQLTDRKRKFCLTRILLFLF